MLYNTWITSTTQRPDILMVDLPTGYHFTDVQSPIVNFTLAVHHSFINEREACCTTSKSHFNCKYWPTSWRWCNWRKWTWMNPLFVPLLPNNIKWQLNCWNVKRVLFGSKWSVLGFQVRRGASLPTRSIFFNSPFQTINKCSIRFQQSKPYYQSIINAKFKTKTKSYGYQIHVLIYIN